MSTSHFLRVQRGGRQTREIDRGSVSAPLHWVEGEYQVGLSAGATCRAAAIAEELIEHRSIALHAFRFVDIGTEKRRWMEEE